MFDICLSISYYTLTKPFFQKIRSVCFTANLMLGHQHVTKFMSLKHFIPCGREILSSPPAHFLSFLQNLVYRREIFRKVRLPPMSLSSHATLLPILQPFPPVPCEKCILLSTFGRLGVLLNRDHQSPVLSAPAGLTFSGFSTYTLYSPPLHLIFTSSNFLGDFYYI